MVGLPDRRRRGNQPEWGLKNQPVIRLLLTVERKISRLGREPVQLRLRNIQRLGRGGVPVFMLFSSTTSPGFKEVGS